MHYLFLNRLLLYQGIILLYCPQFLEILGLISSETLESLVTAIVKNDIAEVKISNNALSKGASAETILDQLATVFHEICQQRF